MKMVKKALSITAAVAIMAMSMFNFSILSAETLQTGPVSMMPTAQPAGAATLTDGVLTVTGTANTAVTYNVNQTYNINTLPNLFYDLSSTANFEITFNTTGTDELNVNLAGDFAPTAGGTAYVDAGDYITSAPFRGSPNWFGLIPADGSYIINYITITLKSEGSIAIYDLYMNDVVKPFVADDTMKDAADLLANPETDWVSVAGGDGTSVSASKVDGAVTLTNVGAGWPAAKVTLAPAITVNVATDSLDYNITVDENCSTNIMLFFNSSDWQYFSLNTLIDTSLAAGSDLGAGTYTGSIAFSDMNLAYTDGDFASWITDGQVQLTGMKIFAVGDAGTSVTLDRMMVRVPKESVIVTFDSLGGSAVSAQTLLESANAVEPTAPTKDANTFGGWYTEAACTTLYDFDTAVTSDITLFAKWTAAPVVTATPTTVAEKTYTKKSLISLTPSAWSLYPVDTATNTITATSGVLTLTNVGGTYPAAGYSPASPIVGTVASDLLSFDITVGGGTNIILFFDGSTPDAYSGDNSYLSISKYISSSKTDANGDLLGNGAIVKGTVALSDIVFPAGVVKNGKVSITGIKIFNVGANGVTIVIRDLSLATEQAAGTTTNPATGNSSSLPVAALIIVSGALIVITKKVNSKKLNKSF